jgi:myo-inositol-1-phosphate synthase
MSKVGVVIIGVNGAVATTLIAGVELMVRGLAPRLGMVTERTDARATELTSLLDFAPLEDMVFAGWDLRFANAYEAAVHHKVFPKDLLDQVKDKLTAHTAWPAVFSKKYAEKAEGTNVATVKSQREEIALLTKNIEDFKRAKGLDRVVMVNLASTETYLEVSAEHKTVAAFEKALDESSAVISPAMRSRSSTRRRTRAWTARRARR